MFFRPNFCGSCGEKIQRAEWKLFTSRRFCDVCAVENQGHEWLPRTVVAAGILAGLFGFGSFLRSGPPPQVVPLRSEQIEKPEVRPVAETASRLRQDEAVPAQKDGIVQTGADRIMPIAGNLQPVPNGTASEQPVYYCGALTKKGKPCSRRVKYKGRCWQHTGQPSALEAQAAPEVY